MKISVLGTGMVGQTIAGKLTELGHTVSMGTRNAASTKLRTEPNRMTGVSFSEWHQKYPGVIVQDYEKLPAEAGLYVNATSGTATMDALCLVGKKKLNGKTLLDIANPLDFSKGMPPTLSISNIDSLAEQIQSEFPKVMVVKGLNTMNCSIMVNPDIISGDHNVFLSGNDEGSKLLIRTILLDMGWKDRMIIDLGDISTSRGTEMLLPLWIRLRGTLGTPEFNFLVARNI